jgi:hypothetical protein
MLKAIGIINEQTIMISVENKLIKKKTLNKLKAMNKLKSVKLLTKEFFGVSLYFFGRYRSNLIGKMILPFR